MSITSGEMTPADIAAVTRGNDDGFTNGNGAWWIIILFLFAFAGGWNNGGFGGGSAGAAGNYVLASDFATIQRQLSDGFNSIDNALDRQNSGICDLGYTQAQLINGVQINQMQNANAIQSQLAQCCCDTKSAIADINYNMAMQGNQLQQAVTSGFCTTNYNAATNTRDIVDNANANTRAILDALNANKVEALQTRISEQNQQINQLQLAASQSMQNQYLIDKITPCPVPAYNVPAPYYYGGCGCGCR